jgi:Protein of unknown function (DUF998)
LIAFVMVIVAMFVSSSRFHQDPRWRRLARPTLIWAIVSAAALLLIPTVPDSLFGIGQRVFILTWLTWAIATSVHARTIATDTVTISAESHEPAPA